VVNTSPSFSLTYLDLYTKEINEQYPTANAVRKVYPNLETPYCYNDYGEKVMVGAVALLDEIEVKECNEFSFFLWGVGLGGLLIFLFI
jgi:hypothetical protein